MEAVSRRALTFDLAIEPGPKTWERRTLFSVSYEGFCWSKLARNQKARNPFAIIHTNQCFKNTSNI